MDVLAGRKTSGRVEGGMWVGGPPKEQHSFARICGYVEQTDIHTPRVSGTGGMPPVVCQPASQPASHLSAAISVGCYQRACLLAQGGR
jgi:hypothetical protein